MATIAEIVVKNQEKMVLFCTYHAQQALLFAILPALNIDAQIYHAGLTVKEPYRLFNNFNGNSSRMVLIGSVTTMSVG